MQYVMKMNEERTYNIQGHCIHVKIAFVNKFWCVCNNASYFIYNREKACINPHKFFGWVKLKIKWMWDHLILMQLTMTIEIEILCEVAHSGIRYRKSGDLWFWTNVLVSVDVLREALQIFKVIWGVIWHMKSWEVLQTFLESCKTLWESDKIKNYQDNFDPWMFRQLRSFKTLL